MRAWTATALPALPGAGTVPRIHDQATDTLQPAATGDTARLYVCGITPHGHTHIGNTATFLAYDLLVRALHDAGVTVTFAQNVTDVDDRVLAVADAAGADWEDLAAEQTREHLTDMAWLGVQPPERLVTVTEAIDQIGQSVLALIERGHAYRVDSPDGAEEDIYFDVSAADSALACWTLGEESHCTRDQMLRLFAENGGDPKRRGKRDRLDPLLWRAARQGEPAWQVIGLPEGRPGWHIECAVISEALLGADFDVLGGGRDLVFPHHELAAGEATALNELPMARVYSHTGMVSYRGRRMSRTAGDQVPLARLRDAGVDPDALRVAILAHHYRSDWEWQDEELARAQERLAGWRAAHRAGLAGGDHAETADNPVLASLREALARDLDAPRALRVLDAWADSPETPELVARAARALLGIDLTKEPQP
jgi:L-cysteine:1D-myo-inositol 2-amino-2-deoxy-alpha-D-glucopyranoside ligase